MGDEGILCLVMIQNAAETVRAQERSTLQMVAGWRCVTYLGCI